jgi:predicted TIM-barrel fold metal-dependent hydrolase
MDDPIAMELIDRIGADTVMWSLDFPHPEGVHGFAGATARSIYDTLGHEKARKVLGGTAAGLYNL